MAYTGSLTTSTTPRSALHRPPHRRPFRRHRRPYRRAVDPWYHPPLDRTAAQRPRFSLEVIFWTWTWAWTCDAELYGGGGFRARPFVFRSLSSSCFFRL